jgi:hypothetical protein
MVSRSPAPQASKKVRFADVTMPANSVTTIIPSSKPVAPYIAPSPVSTATNLGLTDKQQNDLGECIARDVAFLHEHGLPALIRACRGRSDFSANVRSLPHKAHRLLHHLGTRGAPVPSSKAPLTLEEKDSRMKRGPHQSAQAHIEFLREEMLDFIKKGFWLLLPYSELCPLLNLIIHPSVLCHSKRVGLVSSLTTPSMVSMLIL